MDFRTDNNPTGISYLLDALGDRAPSFLNEKEAGENQPEPQRFASPVLQEYPYDTPALTWNSYAYLKTTGVDTMREEDVEQVERLLKLASIHHDIEDELCEIDMILTERTKEASKVPEVDKQSYYALTINKNGEDTHFYPIKTASQTRKSAHQLANDAYLPLEWVKGAALRIYAAAKSQNIGDNELPDRIIHYGQERIPNFKTASEIAQQRKEQVGDPELGNLYLEVVKSAAADSEENLTKYADLWVSLDRTNNLYDRYDKGVTDPYTAFFSGPTRSEVDKLASENVLLLDTLIPANVFQNVKEHINTVFSKKAAEHIHKILDTSKDGIGLTTAFEDLPLDTKKQLMNLAVKKG